MLDTLITLTAIGSSVAFVGIIAFYGLQTANNRPIGNGRLQTLRRYLANEPVRVKSSERRR